MSDRPTDAEIARVNSKYPLQTVTYKDMTPRELEIRNWQIKLWLDGMFEKHEDPSDFPKFVKGLHDHAKRKEA